MAKCSRCGADTKLHVSDVPLCLTCDGRLSEDGIEEHEEIAAKLSSPSEHFFELSIISR